MTSGTAGAKATAPLNVPTQSSVPEATIVLVHGWADSSGWNAEIASLQRRGYPVIAPANPLRVLTLDADYIRSVLKTNRWTHRARRARSYVLMEHTGPRYHR